MGSITKVGMDIIDFKENVRQNSNKIKFMIYLH
jgi:hypothetical protein